MPNRLLKRHFAARSVLSGVNFDDPGEARIEPIYAAWLELPAGLRESIEQDFQDVNKLASEAGAKAMLDEGRLHGKTWPSSSPT